MKIIKTYYLIDYENVGSDGFKGCEKLRETDIIHLFYTDNSRKIDLDIINDHGEAKLVTHKYRQEISQQICIWALIWDT